MARLVNRKYSSRLECVYYIFKAAYAKYGTQTPFSMQKLKYDDNDKNNTHKYCQLLEEGFIEYCPYLENPLDDSKCYATQSVNKDSTKDKAVSDVIRSLEGLGFVTPAGKKFIITEDGEKWINSDFGTQEWQDIIDEAVLSYGPFLGFLHKIKDLNKKEFTAGDVFIGYPNTKELVEIHNGGTTKYIELSLGSTKDSVRRTRSKLISLGVVTGFLLPSKLDESDDVPSHIEHRDFVNKKMLTIRKLKTTSKFDEVIKEKLFVNNPLSYNHLAKEVRSLRENGIGDKRGATLKADIVIKNRRFVIVDILNKASKQNKMVSFSQLSAQMIIENKEFFVEKDNSNCIVILQNELDIAFISGLPFNIEPQQNDIMLNPLSIVNEEVLRQGASIDLLELSDSIWEKVNN